MLEIPFIESHFPGFSFDLLISLAKYLYKISLIKVDFPEPETPVTQLNTPSGILTFICFKLCSCAPIISMHLPGAPFRLVFGTAIFFLPLKY